MSIAHLTAALMVGVLGLGTVHALNASTESAIAPIACKRG